MDLEKVLDARHDDARRASEAEARANEEARKRQQIEAAFTAVQAEAQQLRDQLAQIKDDMAQRRRVDGVAASAQAVEVDQLQNRVAELEAQLTHALQQLADAARGRDEAVSSHVEAVSALEQARSDATHHEKEATHLRLEVESLRQQLHAVSEAVPSSNHEAAVELTRLRIQAAKLLSSRNALLSRASALFTSGYETALLARAWHDWTALVMRARHERAQQASDKARRRSSAVARMLVWDASNNSSNDRNRLKRAMMRWRLNAIRQHMVTTSARGGRRTAADDEADRHKRRQAAASASPAAGYGIGEPHDDEELRQQQHLHHAQMLLGKHERDIGAVGAAALPAPIVISNRSERARASQPGSLPHPPRPLAASAGRSPRRAKTPVRRASTTEQVPQPQQQRTHQPTGPASMAKRPGATMSGLGADGVSGGPGSRASAAGVSSPAATTLAAFAMASPPHKHPRTTGVHAAPTTAVDAGRMAMKADRAAGDRTAAAATRRSFTTSTAPSHSTGGAVPVAGSRSGTVPSTPTPARRSSTSTAASAGTSMRATVAASPRTAPQPPAASPSRRSVTSTASASRPPGSTTTMMRRSPSSATTTEANIRMARTAAIYASNTRPVARSSGRGIAGGGHAPSASSGVGARLISPGQPSSSFSATGSSSFPGFRSPNTHDASSSRGVSGGDSNGLLSQVQRLGARDFTTFLGLDGAHTGAAETADDAHTTMRLAAMDLLAIDGREAAALTQRLSMSAMQLAEQQQLQQRSDDDGVGVQESKGPAFELALEDETGDGPHRVHPNSSSNGDNNVASSAACQQQQRRQHHAAGFGHLSSGLLEPCAAGMQSEPSLLLDLEADVARAQAMMAATTSQSRVTSARRDAFGNTRDVNAIHGSGSAGLVTSAEGTVDSIRLLQEVRASLQSLLGQCLAQLVTSAAAMAHPIDPMSSEGAVAIQEAIIDGMKGAVAGAEGQGARLLVRCRALVAAAQARLLEANRSTSRQVLADQDARLVLGEAARILRQQQLKQGLMLPPVGGTPPLGVRPLSAGNGQHSLHQLTLPVPRPGVDLGWLASSTVTYAGARQAAIATSIPSVPDPASPIVACEVAADCMWLLWRACVLQTSTFEVLQPPASPRSTRVTSQHMATVAYRAIEACAAAHQID